MSSIHAQHHPARPGAIADRIGLAAAPVFAVMAWVSIDGTPGMTLCAAMPDWLPISDMAVMYLLMSVFHLPPWLRLLPPSRPTSEGD